MTTGRYGFTLQHVKRFSDVVLRRAEEMRHELDIDRAELGAQAGALCRANRRIAARRLGVDVVEYNTIMFHKVRLEPVPSFRLKRYDLALRTAYAQAKELALAQREVPLLTPGALQTEKRGHSNFVYRYRCDAIGKRIAEYLGPEGAQETAAKVAAVQEELRSGLALADYSRDLRKIGFYGADNSTMVPVTVPDAGRYAVHKLAVYATRPAADAAKREKDAFQAAALAAVLAPEQDFVLQAAADAMSRTLRAKARPGARRALQWLGESHARASELLASLA